MFIPVFTRTHQWSASWVSLTQPSHSISLGHILVVYLHLRLGLWSGSSLQVLRQKNLYFSYPYACCMLLDLIFLIFYELYKLWSFLLCSFVDLPVTFTHVVPNIFLSTLFSNNLNPCFFLRARARVTHSYETTVKL